MSIYFEIEGLVTDENRVTKPCWHSLCQYTDEHTARVMFEAIIRDDLNPGDQYEDFRFVPATPVKPKLTRQQRQERRQARSERQARKQAKDAASGTTASDSARSKPRRKAPKV